METVNISAVSYLNTKPFLYGLEKSSLTGYELSKDIPSECARKLLNKEVDLGLVPVAVIPQLDYADIVTDFCIGAVQPVHSVMLYSQVPLEQIERVYLDYQSRTSVNLVRVLASKFWNISPEWVNADKGFEEHISGTDAAVIIGDRTFDINGKHPYEYDLAGEWIRHTGMPFVFACWVANKKLPDDFIDSFNRAMEWGIAHKGDLIEQLSGNGIENDELKAYFFEHISYELTPDKRKGMALFLEYAAELKLLMNPVKP